MRKILTRDSYLNELNLNLYSKHTGISPINEEAPFATDIPWGDSLIGRLINSVARKTKIAFNKRRISGLVTGLKSIFDEILEVGKYEITGDSQEFLTFIKVSDLLKLLSTQVKDEEDVSVLINTTKKSEDDLESGDEDLSVDSDDYNAIFYKNSRLFLQSVVDLSRLIKQNVVRVGGGQEEYDNKIITKKSQLKVGSEYLYLNSKGEKIRCKLLSLEYKVERALDKKWMTSDDKKGSKLNSDQACVVYKMKSSDYNDNYKSEVVEVLKLYNLEGKEPSKTDKPTENISTYFDVEKFKSLEKTWTSSKNSSQLQQLIKMCQSAIKIYTAKKDTANIKFFTDKLNTFLITLARQQAKSLGISTTVQKKIAKPGGGYSYQDTGVQKNLKQLQDDISKFSKKPYSIDISVKVNASFENDLSYYELVNEVEANLGKSEVLANNAWRKVVKAHNDSKIDGFIKIIEDLLSVSSKDGKENFKNAKKDINAICKQVILNKSTVGTVISFENLIKEAVNVNDISKSISLFARVILAFREDMTLVGSYGSAIKPLKTFISSFDLLDKTLPKLTKESVIRYSK